MRIHKKQLSSFSQALKTEALCIRPDHESSLLDHVRRHQEPYIARGAGFSYNDSCLHQGLVIDTTRFNHLIDFDPDSCILICQGNVVLRDLFLIHPQFIPYVMPGTLKATIAGCIAHDVHGKNNHQAGSFGHHVVWMELLIGETIIRCSREEHADLFQATLGGAGLTGMITRVALRLKPASRGILTDYHSFESLNDVLEHMATQGLNHDHQAAWMDLLSPTPRAILSLANQTEYEAPQEEPLLSIPPLPLRLIHSWTMKRLNQLYFKRKRVQETVHIEHFNNPLDSIRHWNRIYGPKGLIQFQAVFTKEQAKDIMEHLIALIRLHKATPTLTVLKLFTQSGEGYLSFCTPGFTVAIDFINNTKAQKAVAAMNAYITEIKGRVYLAKDVLLRPDQFQSMYPHHESFIHVLQQYQCRMRSHLSQRLGITL